MENYEIESEIDSEASELSLSCGSSPFDDGEGVFSDVEEENESELADEATGGIGDTIQPYQFEPYLSNPESESSDQEAEDADMEHRLNDTNWCTCGQCEIMPTARECICCSEIDKVTTRREEYPDLACITSHPGFNTICLDIHVLRVAYLQYRQQYGERPEENNERHRYTAYRQFVRWCWYYLGKEVRVIIPACAVRHIRSTFPNEEAEYTGFHSADSD